MTSPAQPRVVFRADAGQRIGTGHVMRCIAIADALRASGASCRFVCKAHAGHMADQLRSRAYEVDLLPLYPDWRGEGYLAWLGGPVDDDADRTAQCIAQAGGADLLVVDHYALGAAYHGRMRRSVPRIAVIDDLHDRAHDCDLLIDQNFGHADSDYAGHVPPGARLLVGADYAPIRSDFADLRAASLRRRAGGGRPRSLLIALGGADPDNVTVRALAALRPPLVFETVHVVLSGISRHLEAVRALVADRPDAVLHVDTKRMPDLMAGADLAIGAAGVTAIERCVLGLPTAMAVLAENQVETARRMADYGATLPLGQVDAITAESIHRDLSALAGDPDRLRAMSRAAAALCDGKGLGRIVPALLETMSRGDSNRSV